MTPSATVAESNDSMAPRMAMVMAGETSPLMTSQVRSGTCACGSVAEMEKRSPMVSMVVTPAYCLRRAAAMVISTMAISEPGSLPMAKRCVSFGQRAMTATEPKPMRALQRSMVGTQSM